MSRFWSPLIASLKPYVAGEQPRMADLIKLNTNENPYGPSPKVLEAIRDATTDELRRYPDPSARRLRETIAARHGVSADQVFAGNGSDEVLAFAFAALLNHDQPLLYPDITYSFYPTYCRLYGIDSVEIPLDADFGIRIADYDQPCGAIILPNPNAPTGIGLPLSAIEEIVRTHPDQVVVIDEAYVDSGGATAIPLVSRYENLLIVQTLSKSRALAGLRVGFAIGQRPLIEALERIKDSFNSYPLDTLAQSAAIAAFEDENWFEEKRQAVIAGREELVKALQQRGFATLPSKANFVLTRHETRSGGEIAAQLRQHAVIVRHFASPRIADFLRITIGTPAECQRLLTALDIILAG